MKQESKADAAAHQPSKAELEEEVSIDATPKALAWAVARGGAVRRDTVARDPSISTTELRRKVGVAEEIPLDRGGFESRAIAPFLEMGAYETLWTESKTTFKSLSELFARNPGCVSSDFVPENQAYKCAALVQKRFEEAGVERFGVRVHGAGEYPAKLRDATYPVECLYYRGHWDFVELCAVAVVGTRTPSLDGSARARRLVRNLVTNNFTVVSGLAAGIDRVAHETAIEEGGRTIAVIGTPLSHIYPKQNAALQKYIAEKFLVVSQVPVMRYESQDYRRNRAFFPERNITMSALTEATIIVEAGNTSGTLIQARAALKQGRKLFILDSCFHDSRLTWPEKLARHGAIRVRDYDDIRQHLPTAVH